MGVDGAEWEVIEALWVEGKLPHLRALAERGTRSGLATDYGISPVIWTTIATGVRPEVHGITEFVVPTAGGDVPVSSRLRRAPALWNMLDAAGRRTAVVGWWASWPAEPIAGVVVSDRAGLGVADEVSPIDFGPTWSAWRSEALATDATFPAPVRERDAPLALAAERLAAGDFDLVLAYLRGVDLVSHRRWRAWRPELFPPAPEAEVEQGRAELVAVYEATDAAIGRLVAAAGAERNVLVVSDHGFHAQRPEKVSVQLDLDHVLERLGYQRRGGDGIDWSGTDLYTYGAQHFRPLRKVRFALAGREPGGRVGSAARAELRRRFEVDLAGVTYGNGTSAFGVRDATAEEAAEGADFMVVVSLRAPTPELRRGDEVWSDIVGGISRISGTHGPHTAGIFIAAGPDVEPGASLAGISIHDLVPTLLYGLGLPVAEDFTGHARRELFTERFRAAHPLRSVPSYGTREPGEAPTSGVDEELMRELEALGYLD
jgi:predicted AlkP superfamily phosphohydrolase/phosphomutase